MGKGIWLSIFLVISLLFGWADLGQTLSSSDNLKYRVPDQLKWNKVINILPGIDEYQLSEDDQVRLIIGIKEKNGFFSQAESLSDQKLLDGLFESAHQGDLLLGLTQVLRKSGGVHRNSGQVLARERLEYVSDGKPFFEIDLYVFTPTGTAFANLIFPKTISKDLQKKLELTAQTLELNP